MMLTDASQKELVKIGQSAKGEDGYYQYTEHKNFAGCTATVLLVTPNEIYCSNAGDPRTVLSKNKQAVDMSKDHKPDDPEEKKRMQVVSLKKAVLTEFQLCQERLVILSTNQISY